MESAVIVEVLRTADAQTITEKTNPKIGPGAITITARYILKHTVRYRSTPMRATNAYLFRFDNFGNGNIGYRS